MLQSEKDIYEWKSAKMESYHQRQLEKPYRSTVHFEQFLRQCTSLNKSKLIDIACGMGGVARYLSELYPDCEILGMDFNENFKDTFPKGDKLSFEVGDIYNIDKKYARIFDGAICLQTLSWLPGYEEPLKEICGLRTKWIAMSLLGYEGKINFNIGVENYESLTPEGDFTHSYYNIYSLPLMEKVLRGYGFQTFSYQKFEIDIDLEKPKNWDLGTYTIMTAEQNRIQISGALLMPWYFVYAKR